MTALLVEVPEWMLAHAAPTRNLCDLCHIEPVAGEAMACFRCAIDEAIEVCRLQLVEAGIPHLPEFDDEQGYERKHFLAARRRHAEYVIKHRLLRDRPAEPPPFAVGTKLKYVGPSRLAWSPPPIHGTTLRWLTFARDTLLSGSVHEVVRVSVGQRGDLTQHRLDDQGERMWLDDDGRIPALDITLDGTSALRGVKGRYVTRWNQHHFEVIA